MIVYEYMIVNDSYPWMLYTSMISIIIYIVYIIYMIVNDRMAIYSELIYPLKMVIFHSYVKLPEGTLWSSNMACWRSLLAIGLFFPPLKCPLTKDQREIPGRVSFYRVHLQ